MPTQIVNINVWRWYYLRTVSLIPKEGEAPQMKAVSTLFFLSFDKPVKVSTLEVNSPDFKLPTHEVKEFNSRFAIIAFLDALPMGTLELTVRNRAI